VIRQRFQYFALIFGKSIDSGMLGVENAYDPSPN
jgi:hypothetical protein